MRAGDDQRQDTLAIGGGEDRTQSPGGSAWPAGQEEDGTGEGTAGVREMSLLTRVNITQGVTEA